ncbi:hypothetical protein VNI00_017469 [Paramarasmius palmivorus]|uniref:Uncharacterized protein n=1 Tax=Paramarasmius palmivorus TaxID=297713 RepID=A0AAW0B6J6_9AGAR
MDQASSSSVFTKVFGCSTKAIIPGTSIKPLNGSDKGKQRAREEYDADSGEVDSKDGLVAISVPKAVVDEAVIQSNASLNNLLHAKDTQIEELQKELNSAKALIEELQVRAEEKEESHVTPQAPADSKTLSQRIVTEIKRLPLAEKLPVKRKKLKPVSFMEMSLCSEMGWERIFQAKFRDTFDPPQSQNVEPLYIPGRIHLVNDKHAYAVVPMTQTNSKHDFELLSAFDTLYGEIRELFFDKTTQSSKPQNDVFYAGTYRILGLKHLHLQGMAFNKTLSQSLDYIVDSVADAQVQRPMLGRSEIRRLVKSGSIKLEMIGLQYIKFNADLYGKVTVKGRSSKQSKAQAAGAPNKKKRKAKDGPSQGTRSKRRKLN